MRFVDIAYHDYEGPALRLDERERLVRTSATAKRWCCATSPWWGRSHRVIKQRFTSHGPRDENGFEEPSGSALRGGKNKCALCDQGKPQNHGKKTQLGRRNFLKASRAAAAGAADEPVHPAPAAGA